MSLTFGNKTVSLMFDLFFIAYVKRNGKNEIIDYLKSLGGSPYLNGDSWDPTKFNISRIIEIEPYYGVLLLLDFEFKIWDYERDRVPSLVKEGVYYWNEKEKTNYEHFNVMLKEMHEVHLRNTSHRQFLEDEISKAVDRVKDFNLVSLINQFLISLNILLNFLLFPRSWRSTKVNQNQLS